MILKPNGAFQRSIGYAIKLLDRPNVIMFVFPITVWTAAVILKLYDQRIYGWLVKEDGLVEYISALFYLMACLLGILIFRTLRNQNIRHIAYLFLSLAIGFAFIFGEEISWGQRILGVETPEYIRQYNKQGEINLHNTLDSQLVHMVYIVISLYGMFGWYLMGRRINWIIPNFSEWCLPAPSLCLYFAPTFLIYFFFDFLSPLGVTYFGDSFGWGKDHFVIARDQELAELFLSMAFCIFLLQTIQKVISYSTQKNPKWRPLSTQKALLCIGCLGSDEGVHLLNQVLAAIHLN